MFLVAALLARVNKEKLNALFSPGHRLCCVGLLSVADGGSRRLLHAFYAGRDGFPQRRKPCRVVGRRNGLVHVRLLGLDIHRWCGFRLPPGSYRSLSNGLGSAVVVL